MFLFGVDSQYFSDHDKWTDKHLSQGTEPLYANWQQYVNQWTQKKIGKVGIEPLQQVNDEYSL